MSGLDPRIEAVRAQYGLASDDFWQIPQNKQWVCKHAALEVVATKADVKWSLPQIIEARTEAGIAVLSVMGTMGTRSEWATGEASPKNNKNSYPWAMAEKRAKDRVVLKLVGIHGLVYSEDEMGEPASATAQQAANSAPETPKASAAAQKRGLEEIDRELLDCQSVVAVNKCADGWQFISKRDGWSHDYKTEAAKKFAARRTALSQHDQEAA